MNSKPSPSSSSSSLSPFSAVVVVVRPKSAAAAERTTLTPGYSRASLVVAAVSVSVGDFVLFRSDPTPKKRRPSCRRLQPNSAQVALDMIEGQQYHHHCQLSMLLLSLLLSPSSSLQCRRTRAAGFGLRKIAASVLPRYFPGSSCWKDRQQLDAADADVAAVVECE